MDFISISVLDIIDIVVVAIIIYYVYKLIRGSNSGNILWGIASIWIIWRLVDAMNIMKGMRMLSAILDSVVNIGIIALVIIFQPELRRFLQMLGAQYKLNRKSFFGRLFNVKSNRGLSAEYINPVVRACGDMSMAKTGALIVIKQDGNLQEVIDSGVKVDAVISASLLKNIFFKNSPLHDGAIVIDKNRIVAAKCVLPSTRLEVPISFGMRHRAAMGISEVSDAIVIVVSEETGNISVAHNGKINIGLSSTELKAELLRLNEEDK